MLGGKQQNYYLSVVCGNGQQKKTLHQTRIEPVSLAFKASTVYTTGIGPMLLTFKASMLRPLCH